MTERMRNRMEPLLPGDRVEIIFADDPSRPVQATICNELSDQQEGLSPEIEDYVACWLEVALGSCQDPQEHRSISLGTDFRYSMDGRALSLRKLPQT